MKEQRGFTLVELMVVVSIAILLLAWGIPSFSIWNTKHNIESQMVQLYGNLQFARMNAYSAKVVSGVWWGGGAIIASYQIRYDNSSPLNNSIDDTGTDVRIGAVVTPKYAITPSAGQQSVSFDGRGFLNVANAADTANPITFSVAPSFGAFVDCVSVSSTKITLGKMNGGSCQPR